MAYFPTSPIDGQVTTINGIAYSYDAGRTVWKRVVNNLGNLTVTGNITSANVSTGNVYISTGVFWANGTAFASFPSALDANVGTLYLGNISTQANLGTLYNTNNTTQANIGTLYLGNIATQANLGAYQLYANSNAAVQAAALGSLATGANANTAAYLLTATGNIAAGNIAVTSNITVGNIFTANYLFANGINILSTVAGSYSNTNVIAYLTQGANIGSGSTTSNLVAAATTTSTNTTTGALVVKGGAGIAGPLFLTNTNDVSANIGTLYQGNLNTQVNIGAFYAYANANIGTLYQGNISTQVNIGTLYLGNLNTQVNIGAFYAYANANIGTLYQGNISTQANLGAFQTYSNSNAATQATSINTINANLGAFENYANTKIGTNTNSNLVVVSTTTSTSSTTGALVVGGGAGIAGNVYTDKVFTTNGIFWAGNNAPWMAQFTASATPPSTPSLGSYWYKTTTDVVYEYVNDGVNSFWMDITTPPFVANVVTSTYIGDVYAGNITFTGSITGSVGYLLERANVVAYSPPAMTNLDLITSPIIYFTSNSTQNITANIRGNANVTLNSILAVGQSATFVVFMPNATSYYVSAIKIDNVTVTPFWQGGASIIGGNANSLDVYTFAVLKTANATFKVFASQVKYQNLGP